MGTTLTGKRVQNTYDSLLKLSNNDNLTGTAQIVTDGLGNDSPIYLSTTRVGIGVSPTYEFQTNSNAKIGGNLIVGGNLTVNGTTTIVDSTVVAIGDNMIEMAKDNVANTMDIGWYGTIVESGTKFIGMKYDAGSGVTTPEFHIGLGTVEPGSTASWTTKGKLVIGDLSANGGDFTDTVYIDDHLEIENSSGYGYIEVGGSDGGYIDLKGPFSNDFDLRLFTGGTNSQINAISGALDITANSGIDLQYQGSNKLSVISTGIDITGNLFVSGGFKDSDEELGTSGQILSSTGTGTDWIDNEADSAKALEIDVKNVFGATMTKGTVVHAEPTGTLSGNVIEVVKADANVSANMPAIGILNEDLNDDEEGKAVMFGTVQGIDTSSFSVGDELYVSTTAGAFTNTKPTATTELVQKIAVVVKSHASNGLIKVFGAGRSNDVPNLLTRDITIDGADFYFGDADQIRMGDSIGLRLQHAAGGDSYIDGEIGNIYIRAESNDSVMSLQADDGSGGNAEYIRLDGSNGSVYLNYYGTKKLETTSSGVTISDDLRVNGILYLGAGADITYGGYLTNKGAANEGISMKVRDDDGFEIYQVWGNAGEASLSFEAIDEAVKLYYAGSEKLKTTNSGVTVTGQLIASTLLINGTANREFYIDTTNPDHLKKNQNLVLSADPDNSHTNTVIEFHIDGSEKASLNSTGNFSANGRGTFNELELTSGADHLTITETSGDWTFNNAQQNNGITIYDGTGGVDINYNGSSYFEVDASGVHTVANIDFYVDTNLLYVDATNNLVGIGKNPSTYKLDVAGKIASDDYIIAGLGNGGVALTHNDGGGNANVTFNHVSETPEQNGNSFRIRANTDSSSGATMRFEIAEGVTSGVSVITTEVFRLEPQNATFAGDVTVSGGDITLGGTGRIQGIDTITDGTDAVNKDYVDNNTVDGNGTANYIPKWTDPDTLDDSIIYESGSKIGIDTTTLNYKLNVNGNLFASGDLILDTEGDTYRIGADTYTSDQTSGVMIRPADEVNPTDGDALFVVRSGGGSPRLFVEHSGTTGTTNSTFTVGATSTRGNGDVVLSSTGDSYFNGGNLGIQHTTPQFGLTLAQGTGDGNRIGWEDGANNKRASIICSSSTDALQFHTGTSDTERMRITSGGDVGINEPNPLGNLHIEGGQAHNRIYLTTTSNAGTGYDVEINMLKIETNSEVRLNMGTNGNPDSEQIRSYQSNIYFRTNDNDRVDIDSNGRLRLVENLRIDNTTTTNTALSIGGTGVVEVDYPGVGGGRFKIDNDGNVSLPRGNLDISSGDIQWTNGEITSDDNNTSARIIARAINNPANDECIFAVESSGSATRFGVTQGNGGFFRDELRVGYTFDTGSVGTPSYDLDVSGDIRATDDIVAFSDIRVKENIITIDSALDKVNKLRGVEYNKIGQSKRSIGVIAQEIEKVLPEVVSEDAGGMKSVAYGNITSVLIEAIKELSAKVEALENKKCNCNCK